MSKDRRLCECSERPCCEMPHCSERAWATVIRAWGWHHAPRAWFVCHSHYQMAFDAEGNPKPIRGLDPMVKGDQEFRPSLFDMIKFAKISVQFEQMRYVRREHPIGPLSQPWDWKYTSAQLLQVMVLRRHAARP